MGLEPHSPWYVPLFVVDLHRGGDLAPWVATMDEGLFRAGRSGDRAVQARLHRRAAMGAVAAVLTAGLAGVAAVRARRRPLRRRRPTSSCTRRTPRRVMRPRVLPRRVARSSPTGTPSASSWPGRRRPASSALQADSRVQGVASTAGLGVKAPLSDTDQGPLGERPGHHQRHTDRPQWDMRQIQTPGSRHHRRQPTGRGGGHRHRARLTRTWRRTTAPRTAPTARVGFLSHCSRATT